MSAPQLISSAVSGKKFAPKAAPRRRPAPPPPPAAPATASTPASAPSESTSVPPPSPPPTQQPLTPVPVPTTQDDAAPARAEEAPAPPPSTPAQPRAPTPPPTAPAETAKPPAGDVQEQDNIDPQLTAEPSSANAPDQTTDAPEPAPPTARTEVAETDTSVLDPAIVEPTATSAATPDVVTAPQQPPKRKAAAGPRAPPAKRAKRNSARSNTAVQDQAANDPFASRPEGAQSQIEAEEAAASSTASQTPADSAIEAQQSTAPARKGRPARRKPVRKSAATIIDSDAEHVPEVEPDGEAATTEPPTAGRGRKRKSATTPHPRAKRRKPSNATPAESDAQDPNEDDARQQSARASGAEEVADEHGEDESDPELHEIDPNTVTMYGLSYDRRRGKTSERERKMAEIDWEDVARKRREQEMHAIGTAPTDTTRSQPPPDVRETIEGETGTSEPQPEQAPERSPTPAAGPDFRIDVDGNIVTDETQLVIDQQAQTEEEAAEPGVPVVEENDLTKRVDTMTWVNARRKDPADRLPNHRGKSDPWSEEETERFYDALATFGTDFMTIANMFPSRSRKNIKMKFIREERLDLKRVNAALRGEKTGPRWDLEYYAKEIGRDVSEFRKYENMEHAEREIRESMKEKEQQMQEAIREEELAEEAAKEAQAVRERNRKKAAEKKAEKDKSEGPTKGKGGRKKKAAAAVAAVADGDGGDAVGGAEE